jgi:hypothetical protein
MYHILPYSYDKAKQLNVKISPSENPKYKIKVSSNNGVFICNIGSSNYKDFPHYVKEKGIDYALKRQKLYKIRHAKDLKVVGSRGYYAYQILW